MRIIVDTSDIAHAMANSGIKPSDIRNHEFDGYTNAFADALTELYNLEGIVTDDLKTLKVCPNCESLDWSEHRNSKNESVGKICHSCGKDF